ncbi:hypothetical protein AS156_18535 [Bradyrhizobium macuxiense]|uniref:Uncharacterized protein n=2 Tax=Bradyrhizobium macuxiense TaxID=1755647 RepID=A0A125Q6N3_9BRAD|nr:hypothetical protein AS156_18535 [Bradyrhizobium macuxiense]
MLAVICCSGCGLTAPEINEPFDVDKPPGGYTPVGFSATAQIEYEIKKRIYCDLRAAVKAANEVPVTEGPTVDRLTVKQPGQIPKSWGAQVSLSLQVDETSGLNPGVAMNQALPNAATVFGVGIANTVTTPQSFSLGFGGTVSSTATRTDKFDPYYSVEDLLKPYAPNSICAGGPPYIQNDYLWKGWVPAQSSPFIIESDLRIKEWLVGAMFVANALPSSPIPSQFRGSSATDAKSRKGDKGNEADKGKGGGESQVTSNKDTVSLEIKFIIVTSGSITPTWKLVRFSANSGSSPFFNTGRTRTHDLIITIGDPSLISSNSHLASQIGNSVSSANKANGSSNGN